MSSTRAQPTNGTFQRLRLIRHLPDPEPAASHGQQFRGLSTRRSTGYTRSIPTGDVR